MKSPLPFTHSRQKHSIQMSIFPVTSVVAGVLFLQKKITNSAVVAGSAGVYHRKALRRRISRRCDRAHCRLPVLLSRRVSALEHSPRLTYHCRATSVSSQIFKLEVQRLPKQTHAVRPNRSCQQALEGSMP